MKQHSQRHRSTSLPFRHREEGLDFEIEDYSLDGGKPKPADLAPGEATLDIAPGAPGDSEHAADAWECATIYGTLEVPKDVIEGVFPADERNSPPAELHVAVRCHETIYRESVIVQESPTTAGEYEVRVRLNWEQFRGRVELRPYLVRASERESKDSYASTRNAKVASGQRYEVVVDRWDEDDPPTIDGEEASFSRTTHLPDGKKLYYLDFRNEARPKLWINADYPRIADVLRSDGSVGAEPRMRDVVLDQISYGVRSQLIVRASTAVGRNGDVEYEWQQTVLEAFATEMYDVDDVEDAKQLLRDDVRDPDGVARLVSRIDTELQEYIEPRTQLINLMEEGLRI